MSEQKARSPSSSSGATRQSTPPLRSPVASGIASHGPPSVRAQAVGPSAGSASSHRRSAVCSRRSRRPGQLEVLARPGLRLEREHRHRGVLVAAQLRRGVGERDAAHEAQPSPSVTSSDSITKPSTGVTTSDSAQPP